MGPCVRRDDSNFCIGVPMNPTTSLLDRANLDRDSVRHQVARGLEGADDGELFLEYSQTEALMFDNGRLKQATYDTAQGFGLRAVKDDAVGYAHSSDVSVAALVPKAEIEGDMGDSLPGLQARLMSQALRKLAGAINRSRTAVVFINQL